MVEYIYARVLKKLRGAAVLNSKVDRTSKVGSGSQFYNSVMDRYSYCGYDCTILNTQIGSFCSIASNVVIGNAMHSMSWASTSPVFEKGRNSVKKKFSEFARPKDKQTIIGCDVWIGQNAMVKQGVKIGNGAVIGMGAIVTKDVPAYAVVGGNPARIIKMRFEQETIDALENSKWWLLDDKTIQKNAFLIKEPMKFAQSIIDQTSMGGSKTLDNKPFHCITFYTWTDLERRVA